MLPLPWAGQQSPSSPRAAESNLFADFSNSEAASKNMRTWYFKGLSPAKRAVCGCLVWTSLGWDGKGRKGSWFCRASPRGTAGTPERELSRAAGPGSCVAAVG